MRDVDALVAEHDHERIWLQSKQDAKRQCEGRLWCQDKVWPEHEGDGEPTEYVRADLFESERSRADRLEKALTDIIVFFEWTGLSTKFLDEARAALGKEDVSD